MANARTHFNRFQVGIETTSGTPVAATRDIGITSGTHNDGITYQEFLDCLLYTSPSPRD